MTLTQVLGALLIFIGCPLLGGLPLINWISYALMKRPLSQLGTGNISVSAAFYHGGKLIGIFAALSEAGKGIGAVLLARYFFPNDPTWELIALIALVIGRYWMAKGAGITNVVWGIIVHDPIGAGLIGLIGMISFTLFRDRRSGRLVGLILLAAILSLRHSNNIDYMIVAIALSGLLFWIFQKIPDDLDLPTPEGKRESKAVFRFFRGDKAVLSLNQDLNPKQVGQKAATLSQLRRWGFSIPDAWVLPAGDDPQPLIDSVSPSPRNPLVVRSSAVGEDSEAASAAGQYTSLLNITSRNDLRDAIIECQASYQNPNAVQYRRDRDLEDTSMAVLVQKQIQGVFSGVAFSRDPVEQQTNTVIIEALPGNTLNIVSGKVTPKQYRVYFPAPNTVANLAVVGPKDIPQRLIQDVATLVRDLEDRYHGIPQDVEWTFDGEKIWILQSRPITTLRPIWTRKIAAEVIPGVIPPLTWSINRPLTCGVWGEIFTLVLGDRAKGLDFNKTATLHYNRAYFNATLLGEIFRRMGLPPESLDFLTRGAKFSKPPLTSTVRNVPGLLRLLQRERRLPSDFQRDNHVLFAPTLNSLKQIRLKTLSSEEIGDRIEEILFVLRQATYYSILAPLSLSIRQAVFKVSENELDNNYTPEVSSLRSLAILAGETRKLLSFEQSLETSGPSLFAALAEMPDGESILEQFNQWLEQYGYLSDVATDISVPRWKESPRPVRELFARYLFSEPNRLEVLQGDEKTKTQSWKAQLVQQRLNLKGQVTEIYSQLLAHLRWSFVSLETQWLKSGLLAEEGDIFYLRYSEIQRCLQNNDSELRERIPELIQQRRKQREKHRNLPTVPFVVYGNTPLSTPLASPTTLPPKQKLKGIGASPGEMTGKVKVIQNLQQMGQIDEETILVVPYTDSGWAPLLARAGGLISEVGGRLSHGAIVAREYGIPAVMDIQNATHLFKDGQEVRIDGQTGIVEVLS
ncbi:MAG: glycerol-3-phosphate acyltransferase [Chroococcales cyanobacterium]